MDNMGTTIYTYGQWEIDRLVKKRRRLRKLWRKAIEMEREGIEVLEAATDKEQSSSNKNVRGKNEQGPSSMAIPTGLSKACLTERRVEASKYP